MRVAKGTESAHFFEYYHTYVRFMDNSYSFFGKFKLLSKGKLIVNGICIYALTTSVTSRWIQLRNWNKIKRLLIVDTLVSKSLDSSVGRWCERIDCSSWSIFKPHKLSLIDSGSRTLFNSDSPIRASIADQIRGITTHCRHEWSLFWSWRMANADHDGSLYSLQRVKIASKDVCSSHLSSDVYWKPLLCNMDIFYSFNMAVASGISKTLMIKEIWLTRFQTVFWNNRCQVMNLKRYEVDFFNGPQL